MLRSARSLHSSPAKIFPRNSNPSSSTLPVPSFPPSSVTNTYGRSIPPLTTAHRAISPPSTAPSPKIESGSSYPEMAVDRADKENLPPSTAPATVAAAAGAGGRLHGVAVKRGKLKRLGVARRRVPLRDITNLFVVESAVAEWRHALPLLLQEGSEQAPAVKAEPAVQNALAAGLTVKAGRYSLRKDFR